MIEINRRVQISLKELNFEFVKGSGAGGQKINKTNSCVVLTWNIEKSSALTEIQKERAINKLGAKVSSQGEVLLRSQRFRDRGKNVADCIEKLKNLIAEALKVEKVRRKTKVPRNSIKKRANDKKQRSDIKKGRGKVSY